MCVCVCVCMCVLVSVYVMIFKLLMVSLTPRRHIKLVHVSIDTLHYDVNGFTSWPLPFVLGLLHNHGAL